MGPRVVDFFTLALQSFQRNSLLRPVLCRDLRNIAPTTELLSRFEMTHLQELDAAPLLKPVPFGAESLRLCASEWRRVKEILDRPRRSL